MISKLSRISVYQVIAIMLFMYLRGMLPEGISVGFSWTLTRCQSTNFEPSTLSCHRYLLEHMGFLQAMGCLSYGGVLRVSAVAKRGGTSVYLNCCSRFGNASRQSMQLKVPNRSSGRTSEVRVTVPESDTKAPTTWVFNSLILFGWSDLDADYRTVRGGVLLDRR